MAASKPTIQSLEMHPRPFVTTNELSEYWLVSRKQIYKQIQAGTLKAIRLGPRLMRISTVDALSFERLAKMEPERETVSSKNAAPRRAAPAGR